jgi:hypothetical protein
MDGHGRTQAKDERIGEPAGQQIQPPCDQGGNAHEDDERPSADDQEHREPSSLAHPRILRPFRPAGHAGGLLLRVPPLPVDHHEALRLHNLRIPPLPLTITKPSAFIRRVNSSPRYSPNSLSPLWREVEGVCGELGKDSLGTFGCVFFGSLGTS